MRDLNERQIHALRVVRAAFVYQMLSPVEGIQLAAEIVKACAEDLGPNAAYAMAIELTADFPDLKFQFVERGPHDAKPKANPG